MITAEEVDVLEASMDDLTPAEQTQARGLISQHRSRQRALRTVEAEKMFSDPENLNGAWKPEYEQQALAQGSKDTSEDRARLAVIKLFGAAMDQPDESIARNLDTIQRDFSLNRYGKEMSTKEIYAEMSYEVDIARADAQKQQQIQARALDRGFAAALDGAGPNWAQAIAGLESETDWQEFRQSYVDAYSMASRNREIFTAARDVMTKRQGRLNDGAKFTQDTMQTAAQKLAALPPAQQEEVFFMLRTWAEANGGAKGFVEQMAESFVRVPQGMALGAFGMQDDRNLELAIRHLESAKLVPSENGKPSLGLIVSNALPAGNTLDAFANSAPPTGGEMIPLTDEARADLIKQAKEGLKINDMLRRMRSVAEQQIDPIKPVVPWLNETIEKAAYGASGSVGYMGIAMIPGAGGILVSAGMAGQEYDRLRLEHPEMSRQSAMQIATASGVVMGGIEKLQVMGIAGKLPFLERVMGAMAKPGASVLERFTRRAIGQAVFQNVQEGLQDLTPAVMQEVASALRTDVPGVDWDSELKQFWDTRLEVGLSLLPFVLVGAGVSSVRESAQFRQSLATPQTLLDLGIAPDAAEKIAATMRAGDVDGAEKAFREAWKARTPEQKKAAVDNLTAAAATRDEVQQSPETPTVVQTSEGFEVRDTKGKKIAVLPTMDAALVAQQDINAATLGADSDQSSTQLTAEAVKYFNEQDPARRVEILAQSKTLQQAMKEGLATPEQLAERMRIAGVTEGQDVRIFGENVSEIRDGIYTDVSRIYEGADLRDVAEERGHSEFGKALQTGRVTLEAAQHATRTWAEEHPEFALRDDMTPAQVRTVVDEAVADMWRAKWMGSARAGLISKLPKTIQRFLRDLHRMFREVFKRAITLERLSKEGKLAQDWQDWLAESVGIKEEAQIKREADRAADSLSGGVSFALKKGATLNSQKKLIPKTGLEMPSLDVRGDAEEIVPVVVKWLEDHPTAKDPAGRVILVANPENGSLKKRAEHLIASHDKADVYKQGERDVLFTKARSVAAITDTISGAQARAKATNGKFIYLRRYKRGELHAVFVNEENIVTEHGTLKGGLVTQYTLDPTKGIEGAKVTDDWSETDAPAPSVNPVKDAEVDRASTPGPQMEGQQGSTPKTPTLGKLDANGDIVNDTDVKLSLGDYRQRIAGRIANLARTPEGRITIAQRAHTMLYAVKERAGAVRMDFEGRMQDIENRHRSRLEGAANDAERENAERERAKAEKEAALEADMQEIYYEYRSRLEDAGTAKERARLVAEMGREGRKRREAARKQAVRDEYQERIDKAATKAEKAKLEAEMAAKLHEAAITAGAAISRAQTIEAVGAMEAILSVLPPEVRGRIGGFEKLATLTTPEARAKYILGRIDMVEKELERYLREQYSERIDSLLERTKPKVGDNRVRTSSLGPQAQAAADLVRAAVDLDENATAKRLRDLEAAMIDPATTPEQLVQITEEWGIVSAFGDIDNKTASELSTAYTWLRNLVDTGRTTWRTQEEARLTAVRDQKNEVMSTVGRADLPGLADGAVRDLGLLASLDGFATSHYSFKQMMRDVLGAEHPVMLALSRMVRLSTQQHEADMIRTQQAFRAALSSALGIANPNSIQARIAIDTELARMRTQVRNRVEVLVGRRVEPQRIPIAIAEQIVAGGTAHTYTAQEVAAIQAALNAAPRTRAGMHRRQFITIDRVLNPGTQSFITMSPLEAMQYLLSWDQADVRQRMERQGFTAQSATQMESLVSDPFARAVRAHIKQVYRDGYARMNAVYQRMFGMDMPQITNYAPTSYHNASQTTANVSPFGAAPNASGMSAGFVKQRVEHDALIKQSDALLVFFQHQIQGSYWQNFAETTREIRGILGNADVMTGVKQRFGAAKAKQMQQWINTIAQGGGNKAEGLEAIDKLMQKATAGTAIASLGLRVKTIMSQADAGLRFMFSLPPGAAVQGLSRLVTGQLGSAISTSWNSDAIQNRVMAGMSPEVRLILSEANLRPSALLKVAEASMVPIQLTDAALTSVSAAIVYDYHYREALAAGMPEAQATEVAIDAMETAVFDTAQPASVAQRSLVEAGANANPLIKAYMLFRSDARLKFAMEYEAFKSLINERAMTRGEAVRTLVVMRMFALLAQFLADLYKDGFTGYDDDEIWKWENYGRALALGHINGLFIVGDAISAATTKVYELALRHSGVDVDARKTFTDNKNPILSAVDDLGEIGSHPEDLAALDDPAEMARAWKKTTRAMSVTGPQMGALAAVVNLLNDVVGVTENAKEED